MNVNNDVEQIPVPCTIMRAGTSKGVFFEAKDIPPPGPARDGLLKRIMGSDDLLQLDGLGGSRLVTSKIAIVSPSSRPDADVDYTYAIVPPARDIVVYTSNCGNISSGVGPFAIDNGLVEVTGAIATVRIFNTNTSKVLVAHVPITSGRASVHGSFAIPGVTGSGAEIFMDFRRTMGAKTGRVLPTGNAIDTLTLDDESMIEVTMGDVANPCVFIRAADVGATGSELPDQINENGSLLELLKQIRGKAAQAIGLCQDWKRAEQDSPALPLVVLVGAPDAYTTSDGNALGAAEMDLRARLIFYNKCHESMAGTGSMCTAAMSRIPGTLVNQVSQNTGTHTLRIGHPLGVMTVTVDAHTVEGSSDTCFERLGFSRTARRIMDGRVYVPVACGETIAARP